MKLTNDSIRAEISKEMERQGVTSYQLAKEFGVSQQTIHNYLKGTTDGINSVTLTAIMARLNFSVLSPEELSYIKSSI